MCRNTLRRPTGSKVARPPLALHGNEKRWDDAGERAWGRAAAVFVGGRRDPPGPAACCCCCWRGEVSTDGSTSPLPACCSIRGYEVGPHQKTSLLTIANLLQVSATG